MDCIVYIPSAVVGSSSSAAEEVCDRYAYKKLTGELLTVHGLLHRKELDSISKNVIILLAGNIIQKSLEGFFRHSPTFKKQTQEE